MTTRWGSGDRPSGSDYDDRWAALAAAGEDPHGEATFVASLGPASVFDAGCGTGRVAIELDHRGVDVVGVDLDPGFIDRARVKAPSIDWRHADLATVELGREFDVVVAAGNVMIFLSPGTEGAVLANFARHLAPGGRVVTGFQIERGRLALAEFDQLAATAGLSVINRFATWAADPYEGGDYAVSLLVATDLVTRDTH
jgi:SAM-dependent methyltransferase